MRGAASKNDGGQPPIWRAPWAWRDQDGMMTRRDWYIGVIVVAAAVFAHAAFPRYDWRTEDKRVLRINRWTGHTELGVVSPMYGRWASTREIARDYRAYLDDLAIKEADMASGAPGANERLGADVHLKEYVCRPLPDPGDKSLEADVDRILYTECNAAKAKH